MSETTPRIAPLDEADWAADLQPIADRLRGHYLGLVNLHRTLARNPRQFSALLTFAARILNSSLSPRVREIVILRTAWARQIPYEWAHHVIVGRSAGLSDAEIAAIKASPAEGRWSETERALLHAVDELAATSVISDEVWATLAATFDETQLIDITLTVGNYTMLGMVLKAFRVDFDPELADVARTIGM